MTSPGSSVQGNASRVQQVRVEQIRLLFGVTQSSSVPGLLLVAVLTWALWKTSPHLALAIWAAAVTLGRLVRVWHARWRLAQERGPEWIAKALRELVPLNVYDGIAWAMLTWVALKSATLGGSVLIMASMAAISSNTMFVLAPVESVCFAWGISMLIPVAGRLASLGDPAYDSLTLAGVLFLVGLVRQAHSIHNAALVAIELRFENLELLGQLRAESESAHVARGEADRANQAKSKFLAAASHDLRQPVHALGLFLEVLSRSESSNGQRMALNRAKAAHQVSAEMLNTLLDFSRIEAGVIRPQWQSFYLQPLFHKLETELGQLADAKGIAYRCRETPKAVHSDPALLELILRNLISNAIRYTERGGVLVACRSCQGEVVIEVTDTGIGIPVEQQQEVFREFHQLGNPERDRDKGLGLGLAITDGLARALGHALVLTSRFGRGSTFRLRLPLAKRNFQQDIFPPRDIDESKFGDRLPGGLILVIDDDEAVRFGMKQLLVNWGYRCIVAESIDEALTLTQQETPRLMIVDYRLRNNQTGVQAVGTLRARLRDDLPAIIVTGDTAPDRLREATSSGIALLHKPVSPVQLYQALVENLDTRHSESP